VLLGWDEVHLEGGHAPTRFDLGQVAPDHPVLRIHFSYHQGILNTRGLEATGLLDAGADPPGGLRGRTRSGELDGAVLERCFGHAEGIARRALAARDRDVQPALMLEQGDAILEVGVPPNFDFLAFRNLLDAGVRAAGSSDAPCASFDVLASIDFAVRRELPSGTPLFPEQALSVSEAVDLYTRGAAAVLGMAGEIGQLTPGSRADAVVLDGDLLELAPEQLRGVSVLSTLAGGYELRADAWEAGARPRGERLDV